MPNATIVIPCKGRLQNLKECVASLMKEKPEEFRVLVVDYGCPEDTFYWCRDSDLPGLDCLRVQDGTDEFNLSRARNCGTLFSSTPVIVSLDADAIIEDFSLFTEGLARLQENMSVASFRGIPGTQGVSQAMFLRNGWQIVRGYNEAMTGWGYEDTDFYKRVTMYAGSRHTTVEVRGRMRNSETSLADKVRFYERKVLGDTWHANEKIAKDSKGLAVNPSGYGQCNWLHWDSVSKLVSQGNPKPNYV